MRYIQYLCCAVFLLVHVIYCKLSKQGNSYVGTFRSYGWDSTVDTFVLIENGLVYIWRGFYRSDKFGWRIRSRG